MLLRAAPNELASLILTAATGENVERLGVAGAVEDWVECDLSDLAPHFRHGEDLRGFLERCLDAGVLLTPGPAAGRDYATWVRLCFTAVPPGELSDALGRLAGVLGRGD